MKGKQQICSQTKRIFYFPWLHVSDWINPSSEPYKLK